jgi:hypothetical protein
MVEAVRDAYPSLISLVLSGSTATGDYVWGRDEQVVTLHSDIDALLYVKNFGDAHPERLERRLIDIQGRQPSELFQIDIAINPAAALRRIPASYQMAETRKSGVVLVGENVLSAYPANFDPRSARQAFLANLWKPILYWTPEGGGRTPEIDLLYTQVAARFFLDLPLLVCAEAGLCVAGHQARAERYLATGATDRFQSDTGREAVRWALAARRDPKPDREGLEKKLATFAFDVAAALDERGRPPEDPDPALVRRLAAWRPRRTPRRIGGELRSVLRTPRNPVTDLAWLVSRKEATAGAALLGLLAYLATACESPPSPGIAARLAEFAREPALDGRAASWFYAAKQQYWRGLVDLYPSMRSKAPSHQRFLDPPVRVTGSA